VFGVLVQSGALTPANNMFSLYIAKDTALNGEQRQTLLEAYAAALDLQFPSQVLLRHLFSSSQCFQAEAVTEAGAAYGTTHCALLLCAGGIAAHCMQAGCCWVVWTLLWQLAASFPHRCSPTCGAQTSTLAATSLCFGSSLQPPFAL
jgi:hypothetical protein